MAFHLGTTRGVPRLGVALKGYGTPYNAGFVGSLYLAGDHSGYSGHTIAGILGAVQQARTMEINRPTHVLLLGGTNDFYFYPPLGANASTAVDRMHTLLSFLTNRTDGEPQPHIFLSTVPPVLEHRCAVYSQGVSQPVPGVHVADTATNASVQPGAVNHAVSTI
jgi:lysophospholipase L1-like esterase